MHRDLPNACMPEALGVVRIKQGLGESISAANRYRLFGAEILSPDPCFSLACRKAIIVIGTQ